MACKSCDPESSSCNDGCHEWPCPGCRPQDYVAWCILAAKSNKPFVIVASCISASEVGVMQEVEDAFSEHYNGMKNEAY